MKIAAGLMNLIGITGIVLLTLAAPAYAAVPAVLSTSPSAGETGVSIGSSVSVTFDQAMDGSTITGQTFLVQDDVGADVAGAVYYNVSNYTAVFTADNAYKVATEYTVTLTQGITNEQGEALAQDYVWVFTTSAQTAHGNYIDNTSMCASCHSNHRAQGSQLLLDMNTTGVCYTCHDGSASSYDIRSAFSETGPNSVFHPVKNSGNSGVEQLLECSNCHNPHGDNDQMGNLYPKLLRTLSDANDGSYVYTGNDFCFGCHGATDWQYSVSSYAYSGGNHRQEGYTPAHYDAALMQPGATEVTCSQCHQGHASANDDLTAAAAQDLCLSCHDGGANGRNIAQEYTRAGSKHELLMNGVIACSSCHGPHSVGTNALDGMAGPGMDVSDPFNTKNAYSGSSTEFCLTCHDGGSLPAELTDQNQVVPETVINAESLDINKSLFPSSSHGSAGYPCKQCHEEHASDYPSLLKLPEEDGCLEGTCHLTVADAVYNAAYTHPVTLVSGEHVRDSVGDSVYRHAECADCHDVHQATGSAGVDGLLKGVSGVGITIVDNQVNTGWNNEAQRVAEVCYKCHSGYTANSPRDIELEFINTGKGGSSLSYHLVEETVPANDFQKTVAGDVYSYETYSLISGYSQDTALDCLDCHGAGENDGSVHGSDYSGLLRQPYTASSQALCFSCHKQANYTAGSADKGSSGFLDGSAANLHVTAAHAGAGCMACHGEVVHGSSREHLITLSGDAGAAPGNKLNAYNAGSGAYTQDNCTTAGGCHS